METLLVQPENEEQLKTVKAVLKALKVQFTAKKEKIHMPELEAKTKRNEESLAQESAIGMSIEDYTKELENADAEIEAGEYITHEEVKKRFYKKAV